MQEVQSLTKTSIPSDTGRNIPPLPIVLPNKERLARKSLVTATVLVPSSRSQTPKSIRRGTSMCYLENMTSSSFLNLQTRIKFRHRIRSCRQHQATHRTISPWLSQPRELGCRRQNCTTRLSSVWWQGFYVPHRLLGFLGREQEEGHGRNQCRTGGTS